MTTSEVMDTLIHSYVCVCWEATAILEAWLNSTKVQV
jgi:hypothetical protein